MHVLSIAELLRMQIMSWTIETADPVSVSNLADMITRDMPDAQANAEVLRDEGADRLAIYEARALVRRYENYLRWAARVRDAHAGQRWQVRSK